MIVDYWKDGRCFVGRIRGHPSILSQGWSLKALEANIRDALALMIEMKFVERPTVSRKQQRRAR